MRETGIRSEGLVPQGPERRAGAVSVLIFGCVRSALKWGPAKVGPVLDTPLAGADRLHRPGLELRLDGQRRYPRSAPEAHRGE
jgi:hypothetical protein